MATSEHLILASGTRTSDGSGPEVNTRPRPSGTGVDAATFFLEVTAFGGTTPTLIVEVIGIVDGREFTIGTFAQLASIGKEMLQVPSPLPETMRADWQIGGISPSFTFSVDAVVRG